jgi:hypothetical protein
MVMIFMFKGLTRAMAHINLTHVVEFSDKMFGIRVNKVYDGCVFLKNIVTKNRQKMLGLGACGEQDWTEQIDDELDGIGFGDGLLKERIVFFDTLHNIAFRALFPGHQLAFSCNSSENMV